LLNLTGFTSKIETIHTNIQTHEPKLVDTYTVGGWATTNVIFNYTGSLTVSEKSQKVGD